MLIHKVIESTQQLTQAYDTIGMELQVVPSGNQPTSLTAKRPVTERVQEMIFQKRKKKIQRGRKALEKEMDAPGFLHTP